MCCVCELKLLRMQASRRSRSPRRRQSAETQLSQPTKIEPKSKEEDDCTVAALPAAVPGCQPRPMLRLLANVQDALATLFHVGNVPLCLVLLFLGIDAWPASSIGRIILLALLCTQMVLYAIVYLLAMSTTAQGWITFGHPARVIGAANSGGPFDRGARVFGVRDYSQPADVGLPHARPVRIPLANGSEGSLGAWHALPGGMARDVLEEVACGRAVDAAYDATLSASATRDVGSAEVAPFAAIYLHGNFESRSKWVSVEHVRLLSTLLGLHVLAIDYRGFADSTGGPPTAASLGEDALAAAEWLAARGIPPSRVLLYGHSLGSGAAAQLALKLKAAGTPPFGMILEAPFYSLRAAALTFPAALPLLALPGARSLVLKRFMDGCRTGDALAQLPTLPLLLLHGDDDTTGTAKRIERVARTMIREASFLEDTTCSIRVPAVPIQHSVQLSCRVQATRSGGPETPFRFEVLHGCDHLQALLHPQTLAIVSAFLHEVSKKTKRCH